MVSDRELLGGARSVARRLREHGHEAFYAGGCVRDTLLGARPKDYDIVTDARPERVVQLFRRTVKVGAAFGVVRVMFPADIAYEVATYRADGPYSDGRRPDSIAYASDKKEDVLRRDFTINALLMDPESGEVFDYVDGRRDLELRVVRAVGEPERRFAEDRLRMLRAVRFAARLGFRLEAETARAIALHAGAIAEVSAERIVAELHQIWAGPDPGRGHELLLEVGLYDALFPFAGPAVRTELSRLPAAPVAPEERPILAWALLTGGEPAPAAEARLVAFRLSRSEIKRVLAVQAALPGALSPETLRPADRIRAVLSPHHRLVRGLLHCRAADPRVFGAWDEVAADLDRAPVPLRPLLAGEDLKAMGLAPGPAFGRLLEALETEVFERRITTRAEAEAFARSYSLERATRDGK